MTGSRQGALRQIWGATTKLKISSTNKVIDVPAADHGSMNPSSPRKKHRKPSMGLDRG